MGEVILKETIKQTDIFHDELNIVYKQSKNKIFKSVNFKNNNFTSVLSKKKKYSFDAATNWFLSRLDGCLPFQSQVLNKKLNIVDFFSGAGGLSMGIKEICREIGIKSNFLLASDRNIFAKKVYVKNFNPKLFLCSDFKFLIDYDADKNLLMSNDLNGLKSKIDLFLAGPPCEGNSNLNNITRRNDPRNNLFFDILNVAVSLNAKLIILENVPQVINDKNEAINKSQEMLKLKGYDYQTIKVKACEFGVAQSRERFFLVASKKLNFSINNQLGLLKLKKISASQALDYEFRKSGDFHSPSNLSDENKRRVTYLHKNNIFNLPDSERPDCHKLKEHNYDAVYGRMFPDKPAPTITTGFLSPGRGRFTHPSSPRSLTPYEGARLQSFPGEFDWIEDDIILKRNAHAKLIGGAVPPCLAYSVIFSSLACSHILD